VFPVNLHRTPDEQLFERLPELSGHAAVDGEVDRVADDDEKIREQYQKVSYRVIQNLFDAARYYVQHLHAKPYEHNVISYYSFDTGTHL